MSAKKASQEQTILMCTSYLHIDTLPEINTGVENNLFVEEDAHPRGHLSTSMIVPRSAFFNFEKW